MSTVCCIFDDIILICEKFTTESDCKGCKKNHNFFMSNLVKKPRLYTKITKTYLYQKRVESVKILEAYTYV